MATPTKDNGASAKLHPGMLRDGEKVHKVLLSEVNFEKYKAWNSRSSGRLNANMPSEGEEEAARGDEAKEDPTQWAAFKDSFRTGQDTPVILRPCKGSFKYEMLAGGRRFLAIRKTMTPT